MHPWSNILSSHSYCRPESKFLTISLHSLVKGSPSCWTLWTALLLCGDLSSLLLCTASYCFEVVHIPTSSACCHLLDAASADALCHNIYSSLPIYTLSHSLLVAYSDLLFVYLFLFSQSLLYFLYCLIVPSALIAFLPSGSKLRPAHCLPYWYHLELLILLLS